MISVLPPGISKMDSLLFSAKSMASRCTSRQLSQWIKSRNLERKWKRKRKWQFVGSTRKTTTCQHKPKMPASVGEHHTCLLSLLLWLLSLVSFDVFFFCFVVFCFKNQRGHNVQWHGVGECVRHVDGRFLSVPFTPRVREENEPGSKWDDSVRMVPDKRHASTQARTYTGKHHTHATSRYQHVLMAYTHARTHAPHGQWAARHSLLRHKRSSICSTTVQTGAGRFYVPIYCFRSGAATTTTMFYFFPLS